jgi:predicted AAA+ superfamily ATPase
MKRAAYQNLLDWKNNPARKPLIIQGARQVGKTFLMKQFGENEFEQVAYFNFESQPLLCNLFAEELSPRKILQGLELLSNQIIDPKNTLIIFDEIQACKNAITSLKYFQEDDTSYFIVAAGSLLGVAIHQGVSFPVGKVSFLNLYPFNFLEFLEAMGKQKWGDLILEQQHDLIAKLATELEALLKDYIVIGGMPAVVMQFAATGKYQACRNTQLEILQAYENDFSKHAPIQQLPRIRQVWQSIVSQLAKENSKFIYSVLRKGARAKDFELAIEWLSDAGLIQIVSRVKKPGHPLKSYASWEGFKIYLNDTGLLGAMAQLSTDVVLKDHQLFTEFKGILTEQYVLQQLISMGHDGYYWHPENAKAEVDFLISHNDEILPVEVKAARNVKSKSLSVYHHQYPTAKAIRLSLLPYKEQTYMTNIPLYSFVGTLNHVI